METPELPPVWPLAAALHPGESACLSLAAVTPGSLLILDDVAAREVAEVNGLAVTGTLGCLLEAKMCGLIADLAPLLDSLATLARFWISKPLRAWILDQAGG
jgi:predicted nucleic acid-binding protein